jgi:branched-chain amino acid transport system substrate-binding protein
VPGGAAWAFAKTSLVSMSASSRSLLAIPLLALAACSGTTGGTVVLGAAGPWHDANGAANRKGVELALDEINAASPRGYHFEVDFKDDSANGVRAAGVAQEFLSNLRVVGVVGHVNSGAMMAAARVYDAGLPAIATSATSPALSGISRWTFRVIPSDSLNGLRVAGFMSRRGRRRAAVLYENNAYGRGLAESFRRGFTGDIVGFDPVSDRPGEDLEAFVTWYKQRHADLVFVAGTAASGLAFITEARRQQISADLAGGNGWATMAGNRLAEGAYLPTPFTIHDSRPEVQDFVAAYQRRFGEKPNAYAALAYDATKLLADAVVKVGPDRAKIRDYLANLPEPYHGVTGTIAFGAGGDLKDKSMIVARIHDGALEPEAGQ